MKKQHMFRELFAERESGARVDVDVYKQFDRYEITVNDMFYCTCENLNEVDDEIEDIKEEYNLMCA